MSGIDYEFTDKKVSPWGGLRLIEETYRRSGLKQYFQEIEADLPQPGSNRGYSPIDMIEGFMIGVILGARRLSHSGMLRNDEVIRRIFDWRKGMASQSTFSRFFKKFDQDSNDNIFPALNKFWFSQLALDKFTIDVDSTVITRYGKQEGVAKGYTPRKHGRGTHHPLIAFAAEPKMVVNAWMRTGDSSASTGFDDFLYELLDIVPKKRIGLIRADSGFYSKNILNQLESNDLNYIVACKMNQGLVSRIFDCSGWFPIGEGYWVSSFNYRATTWDCYRRIVVVRKDIKQHPKTGGKLLFPEVEEFEKYRYSAFVTNVEFSSEMIWRLYNQRADCENRIRELKYDYGLDGFCMEDFFSTEAAFRWTMVAYNLMSLFRLQVLNSKHQSYLSTIRFQCIALGSYLSRSGRKEKLKLSAREKRRQFLERLFTKLGDLSPPFEISNA